MQKRNSIILTGLTLFSAMILAGCVAEEPAEVAPTQEEDAKRVSVEVPLILSFDERWEIDVDGTRAAPPGVGGSSETGGSTTDVEYPTGGLAEFQYVDSVRVVTYRRPVSDNRVTKNPDETDTRAEEEKEESFIYDPTNSMILPVIKGGDIPHDFTDSPEHLVAKAKITKIYGYEYRIVATAYSTEAPTQYMKGGETIFGMNKGDLTRFAHKWKDENDKRYEDYYAQINSVYAEDYYKALTTSYSLTGWDDFYEIGANMLNRRVVEVPQLFFCECYTEYNDKRDEIIQFSETDKNGDAVKDLPIRGVLYRGMAKVEVRITPTPHKDNVYPHANHYPQWFALLADQVKTRVGLTDYDDFLNGSEYLPNYHVTGSLYTGTYTVAGYKEVNNTNEVQVIEAYLLPGKARLAMRLHREHSLDLAGDYFNFKLIPGNGDWTDAINGTGIISPDVIDGEFYLRRNHKYVISIKDSEAIVSEGKYSKF